jgi:pimeloyl-ACP methyl ester carboxylesterase
MPSAAGLIYFANEADNSTRPIALLIHGAGGTHHNWPPQVRRLGGQWIYALDLPGHGRSEGTGRQLISEYSADIVRFMDSIRLPAAVMVGHSMGAAIALTLALDHSERVLGLCLLGAGASLRVSPAILQRAGDPSTFPSAVAMVTEYAYSRHANPRLKELGGRRMAETRPNVFYGDLLACDSFNVLADLPRIKTPTLVLAAEQDKMTPLHQARTLEEKIPGARLHLVPKAGHMLMLEQPEIVASELAAFLNSLPDRPG